MKEKAYRILSFLLGSYFLMHLIVRSANDRLHETANWFVVLIMGVFCLLYALFPRIFKFINK